MPKIVFIYSKDYPFPSGVAMEDHSGDYRDHSPGAIKCSLGPLKTDNGEYPAIEVRCSLEAQVYFLPEHISARGINNGYGLALILKDLKSKLDPVPSKNEKWWLGPLIDDRINLIKKLNIFYLSVNGEVVFENDSLLNNDLAK